MTLNADNAQDMSLQVTIARALQEIINGGLLTTDRDLTITSWNHWLEINTRLPASSVVGRNLLEVFPSLVSRRLASAYQRALSGQVVVLSQQLHGYLLPMPSTVSRCGLAEMRQSARITPLIEEGRILGTLTLIEDVTERAVYDSELAARANQQASLAELGRQALSGDPLNVLAASVLKVVGYAIAIEYCAVFELGDDGKSMAMTAGAGWPEGIVGQFRFDSSADAHADLRQSLSHPIAESNVAQWPDSELRAMLVRHGISFALNVPLATSDSHVGILSFFAAKSCDFAPEESHAFQPVANIIGMAIERRRLEIALHARVDQLALADQRKNEFLAMLAHELRNPLAPVMSAMELLKMNESMSDQMSMACDVIGRQIGQMKRLIDDLLDVARITQGKINLQQEVFDVATIAAQAVEISRPLISSHGHTLNLSLPSESLKMVGDPTRIAQVLANLLNNAAKYTDPGGRISLTVERRDNRILLRIRDSGVGISREMLAHVFDLFTQVDRSLDRAQGGLGIGLTLVRRIVELHGGFIQAFSEGDGRGSEFLVDLPALASPTEAHAATEDRVAGCGQSCAYDILVLDDNLDAAQLLALLLRSLGHNVQTAFTGAAAIEAVKLKLPSVMFLDIGLPGMDGFEVARRLRAAYGDECPLLVALTGYGRPEDLDRSREAGFSHHLTKPVDRKTLQGLFDLVASNRIKSRQ